MTEDLWHQVDDEMRNAVQSHEAGLEGRSRVCCRRAVSLALVASGWSLHRSINAIEDFADKITVPDEIRALSRTMVQRVDDSYHLPPEVNLLVNAEQIIDFLKNNHANSQG
jgi:hypothetical protein